jgi:hypothetical protein
MIKNGHYPKRLYDFASLALAFIAILITGYGWWWAFEYRIQFASPSLWPMPALFLIDWTALCVLGLLAVYFRQDGWVWLVIGALIPLFVISAWSFGLLVFCSFLLMLLAALIVFAHPGQNWLETLGVVTLGAILHLVIGYSFLKIINIY